MQVDIVLDRAISRQEAVRLGPFREVLLTHRRMRAGELEIVRHFDGGWHWNGASFLEARLEPTVASDCLISVGFARPWAMPSPRELASTALLYGARLYLGPDGLWAATDDDDGRCWIAESTGLANDELVLTAA